MFHKEDSSVLSKGKKSVDVPLRKSDRKTLLRAAERLFGTQNVVLRAVFMEGSLTFRKLLHPTKVVLYYRSASNKNDNDVLWPFTFTKQCVFMTVEAGPNTTVEAPTVALLSILPTEFPTVTVPSHVSKFLCRGAHLMRAGIMSLPSCPPENGIVAIKVHGNAQPFAIGRLTDRTFPESIGSNAKGVGVEVWTCYGDDLWKQALSNAIEDGVVNPIGGACFDNGNYGNVGFLEGKIVRPIVAVVEEEDDGGDEAAAVSQGHTSDPSSQPQAEATDQTEETAVEGSTGGEKEEDNGTINPNDVVLHQAVCKSLVNIKDSDLPMTTANFYAQHVKPRSNEGAIQIKKTSWKKINSYLQDQVSSGLLTCKAHGTDPMGYLTGINRKHQDLRGVKKDKVQSSQTKKLALVNLCIVPHHFIKLLKLDPDAAKATTAKSEERRETGMLTVPEARAIIDQYVMDNELSQTSSHVQLDAALMDALYKKQNDTPPESLSRKDLYKKWLDKMESAYALVEMPGSRIIKLGRGSPPKVSIEVSLRQGRKNKYVTRVRGLEDYDINPVAFCRQVSKRFACAGTVETDPEGRAALKKGRVELDFQGHLVEELRALLLGDEKLTSHGGAKDSDYCLPKSAIDVVLKKNVPAKKPKR